MGNTECFEVYRMGQEAGIIPDYRMDHSFIGYLSTSSSAQLNSHYTNVRNSFSPDQLENFGSSVRATLGQNGTVTQGGVGVVALALSLLFDVLAQQAKNQTGKTHFIHQIFWKQQDANSSKSEVGTVVIDYLNLVPLIANDPQRMKKETDRYVRKLKRTLIGHFERTVRSQNSSWAEWKILIHGLTLHQHMMIHQVRMGADIPMEQLLETQWQRRALPIKIKGLVEITNVVERLMSVRPEEREALKMSKCKDSVLFDRFWFDVGLVGWQFFRMIEKVGPQYMNQMEDFAYHKVKSKF